MPSADRITNEALRSEVTPRLTRAISPEVAKIDRALVSDSGGILGGLTKFQNWAIGLVMGVPLLGKLAGWTANRKFLANSENAIATKVAGHLNGFQKFTTLSDATLGELPEKMIGIGMHQTAARTASLGTSLSKYSKQIFGSKLHGQIAQASTGNAVFAGAGALGETAAAALTVTNRIKTLKAMQADLTGKVPSTFDVVFGSDKLHPMVKRARHELSGAKAVTGLAVQMGGTVANAWLMLRGGNVKYFIPKSIGITMGSGILASTLTSSDTALASYQTMAKSFAQTGGAQMELYAGLIGGLEPRASEQKVNDVARQAFEQQLKPRDVVRLVSKTNMFAPVAMPPVPAGRSTQPVQGKFTQKLASESAATGPAKMDAGKPVQGKFTARAANDPEVQQSLRA